MIGLFRSKKKITKLQEEVRDSFNHVKKDFKKVGDWIKHLDDKHSNHEGEIKSLKLELYEISSVLEELKEMISFMNPVQTGSLSKQQQTVQNKQQMPDYVQTVDRTVDQTPDFSNLTVMERAIVWALLNSTMKLSYEDLASLLGKERSTVRGQINTIKQKNKGLIQEVREPTGKKRLFIPEEYREILLKNVKVRVKGRKKDEF